MSDTCAQCGGVLLRRCPSCDAPFSSIATVDCEECGKPVRPDAGHRADPLASCMLSTESFGQMALRARGLADAVGAPIGAVLEGGYDLGALSSSVVATLSALAEGGTAAPVEPHPLAAAAAAQVGRHWPLAAAAG